MSPLPERFDSPVHLPFNAAALRGKYRAAPPDADPGGPGVWVLLRGGELLVSEEGEDPVLPEELLAAPGDRATPPLYIGTWEGRPCRALRWGREQELPAGLRPESLLAGDPQLPIDLLSLGGTAGQILHWQRLSRYCSRCGGALEPLAGEWGKRCPDCDYSHFPHIHPCAIVLVRRGRELLLTRKAQWPAGRYSLVAGFVDFGECLEECARREIAEETGIEVKNIRYVGSQCWPFPSQLMAGFVAEYVGGDVRVDERELEDARWFSIDALPLLPPRRSIARYILDGALEG